MQKILPIRALRDNYIWMILDENSNQAWVVDPGIAPPVIDTLKIKNLSLAGILITHHHADHSGGVPALLKYAPGIPVYASHRSSLPFVNQRVKEGDTIACCNMLLHVIEIPGHTLDHVAFYGNQILFSGDTLFSIGAGRVFEGTPEQMVASLNKLKKLDEQTKIYCGHEYTLANLKFAKIVDPDNINLLEKLKNVKLLTQQNECTLPSVLKEEKQMNPFLRCEVNSIIEAVEKKSGKKLKNLIEVFTYLREWKNSY